MIKVRVQDLHATTDEMVFYWKEVPGKCWDFVEFQEGILLQVLDANSLVVASFPPGCWFGIMKDEESYE